MAIVTGELSGETHAARLVRALTKALPLRFSGIGGTMLSEAGVQTLCDYRDISLTGLSEVFAKAGHIRRAYALLKEHLKAERPDLVILVDFPGFNMRIARLARSLSIPVVYFIPPQLWAWRKGRIRHIRSSVDLVLCILPFEEALYRDHGVPVAYIGHPYVRTVRPVYEKEAFYARFGIDSSAPVITIMPGSRQNEAGKHMPLLLSVIDHLASRLDRFTVLLPVADSIDDAFFTPFIKDRPYIVPIKNLAHDCLKYADAAVIASGSATLEAALLGVPSCVVYKISAFSYLIARMVVKVKHISLPNILAGKEVFPEFIQSIDPQSIAKTVISLLNNDTSAVRKELEQLRDGLDAGSDPYQAASDRIVQLLEQRYGTLF